MKTSFIAFYMLFVVDEINASIFILSKGFIVLGDTIMSWDLIDNESFVEW